MAATHPSLISTYGFTPIHRAICNDVTIPKLLEMISAGCEIEEQDDCGRTALFHAIEAKRYDIVAKLLDIGANVFHVTKENFTPLRAAANDGDINIFDLILAHDPNLIADANEVNEVLCYSVRAGSNDVLRRISTFKQVNVNLKIYSEKTLLHFAAWTGIPEFAGAGNPVAIQLLIEIGADLEALDHLGRNPLHTAVAGGKTLNVTELLKYGSNFRRKDKRGRLPLHDARFGLETLVKISLPEDFNVQDHEGNTPLHKVYGVENIKLLLEHGADPNIRNHEGKTRYRDAVVYDEHEEMAILEKHGAIWPIKD